MARRVLDRIRELVRANAYGITIHALEELENDDLSGADLKAILLSCRIVEVQRELKTRERKYLVFGSTSSAIPAYAVLRFASPRRLLVLTAFIADERRLP